MRFALLIGFVGSVMVAACGGGDGPDSSGLDRSQPVNTLNADEQMTLCEFTVEAAGGEGATFMCPDDVTVTVQSVSDCLSDFNANYTCTVGQVEDCATSDPCDLAPCFELLSCAGSQG